MASKASGTGTIKAPTKIGGGGFVSQKRTVAGSQVKVKKIDTVAPIAPIAPATPQNTTTAIETIEQGSTSNAYPIVIQTVAPQSWDEEYNIDEGLENEYLNQDIEIEEPENEEEDVNPFSDIIGDAIAGIGGAIGNIAKGFNINSGKNKQAKLAKKKLDAELQIAAYQAKHNKSNGSSTIYIVVVVVVAVIIVGALLMLKKK